MFKRYLNPVENNQERRWFDVFINLSKYANKSIKLSLAANPGPNDNYDADWFGWSTPVIYNFGSFVGNPNDENLAYDFIDNFNKANIFPADSGYGTPTGKIAFLMNGWNIGGEKRTAIITLANGQVKYSLDSTKRGNHMYFSVGMNATIGDGATGFIIVEKEGKKDTVFQRYLNPAMNQDERHWFNEYVNLSLYANQSIKLTFMANPGPRSDDTADWFGWGTPILTFYSP